MTLQLLDWLVWLVPIIAIPFVPVVGRLGPRVRAYFAVLVSILATAIAFALLYTSPLPREASFAWLSSLGFNVQLRIDGLSIFLALIVNSLGSLIVLYSVGYMRRETGLDRYYALVLLFIGSMTGLVIAGNFLQLYIFWELVGICSSFLIAFWYDRPEAVRAGLKAFIVTRAGDAGLLLGIVYLYLYTGSVSFARLESLASLGLIPSGVLVIGGLLVFAGAIGKSAQFPLHVWLPDAMEGPTTVSALIHAATMVNAGVYLVVRTYPIFSASSTWLFTIGSVGTISALLAASLAMAATDIKRVLAYSTISQLGLMFAALGLGTSLGLFASEFHLLSQGVFKALGFLAMGSVILVVGTRNMNEMGGLRSKMPLTYWAFLFASLAMVGVPPFIGFWSKDLILKASLENGSLVLFGMILLVSVMTSFYTFRALFKVFIVKPSVQIEEKESHESWTMTLPLIILGIGVAAVFAFEESIASLLGSKIGIDLDPVVIGSSLTAMVFGFVPAYLVYVRYGDRSGPIIAGNSWLRSVQSAMLEGYGIDWLYGLVIVRPLQFVADKVRGLQSGILGVNLWGLLLFVALILVVLLL